MGTFEVIVFVVLLLILTSLCIWIGYYITKVYYKQYCDHLLGENYKLRKEILRRMGVEN